VPICRHDNVLLVLTLPSAPFIWRLLP